MGVRLCNGKSQLEAVMADEIDPVELACEIAEIASTTRDPETGRRLVTLADRLLTPAGLPLAGEAWSTVTRLEII